MKAKFVLENIEFQRGIEPKQSLSLGIKEIAKNMSNTEWLALMDIKVNGANYDYNYWKAEGVSRDRIEELYELFDDHIEIPDLQNYKGKIASFIKLHMNGRYIYDTNLDHEFYRVVFSDFEFSNASKMGRSVLNQVFESGFQRGLDPKKALDVGVNRREVAEAQIRIQNTLKWAEKPRDIEEVEAYGSNDPNPDILNDILEFIPIIHPDEFVLPSANWLDAGGMNQETLIRSSVPEKFRHGLWGVYADNEEEANYLIDCAGWSYPRYVAVIK